MVGQQFIEQCDDFTVDLSQGSVPIVQYDPLHPITGKTVWFEFEARSEYTVITTSPVVGEPNGDVQLHLFDNSGPVPIPVAWDDNSNVEEAGHAEITFQYDLGRSYLMAVSAVNMEDIFCQLNVDGFCNEISEVRSGLLTLPLAYGVSSTAEFNAASIISAGYGAHFRPSGGSTFPAFDFAAYQFFGTGGDVAVNLSYSDAEPWEGTLYVLKTNNDDSFTIIGADLWESNVANRSVEFTTEINTEYILVFELNDQDSNDVEPETSVSIIDLDDLGNNSGQGTNEAPFLLYDGFEMVGQSSSFPDATMNPCLQNLSSNAAYFQFIGDGSSHWIHLDGMLSFTKNCGVFSYQPCEYNYPVLAVLWNETDQQCELSLSNGSGSYNLEFIAELGDEYRLLVYPSYTPNPLNYVLRNTSWNLTFGSQFQSLDNVLQDIAEPFPCGSTTSIEVQPANLQGSLIQFNTPCGDVSIQNEFKPQTFIGDGDTYTIQTIDRSGSPDEVFAFLTVVEEDGGDYQCLIYQAESDNNGFIQENLVTELGKRYYIFVEAIAAGSGSKWLDLELYSPFCVDCFGQFSAPGFPVESDSPLLEATLDANPLCCLLGWDAICDDYIREVALFDEITPLSESVNCGSNTVQCAEGFDLFDGFEYSDDLGNEFETTKKMWLGSIDGTGEVMSFEFHRDGVNPIHYAAPGIMVYFDDGEGYEYYILDVSFASENGPFGVLNFSREIFVPSGTTAYIMIADNNEDEDFSNPYEMTILDPNNCGYCESLISGEADIPLDDPVFDTVVSLNPSCCAEWSASCQSSYEFFYFPNCAISPVVTCGDTLSGSTIGEPIYTGQKCDNTSFTSGSIWYTFVGDGSTFNFDVLQRGNAWNAQIYGFIGECPSPECLGNSDSAIGGALASYQLPTIEGETYFVAITGINGDEGDFDLHVYSSDYCGQCFTAYSGMHVFENQNPIYQQVISAQPSCCNSFWDADCQALYDGLICSSSFEPNNTVASATTLGLWSLDLIQDNVQAAISSASDVDIYMVNISAPGSMFLNLVSQANHADLTMELWNNETLLASADNSDSFEFLEQYVEELAVGSYFIHVKASEGASFDTVGCYELFLDWVPDDVPGCTLTVSVDDVSACDPATGTHEVSLEIEASNVGGTTYLINGQPFPITDQVQYQVVPDQPSTGAARNLVISVLENPMCTVVLNNAYIAPESCGEGSTCVMDGNADGTINAADLLVFLSFFGTTCD
ncbi:hypothetical protein [Sanyastnella coralliicola]|uniref:hypothetical protein n=1 Tax=Sanyastnella coralliicola TaxID=3069118 RepID=UPI0027BA9204|nr:hypothetical protein [Longitalea sp. SCSIO 12813]